MTAPIVRDFLRAFIDVDPFIEASLQAQVSINEEDTNVHFRLNATIIEYTLADRGRILSSEWWSQATPEQIEAVNPPGQTMMKLNAICGYHAVDRVAIYLYLHAWIKNEVAEDVRYGEALNEMDQLVTALYVN